MAVREFDGTDDDIVRAIGALSGMTHGTILALVKPGAGLSDVSIVNLHDSGGTGDYAGLGVDSDEDVYWFDSSFEAAWLGGDLGAWNLVVARLANDETARLSIRIGSSWFHGTDGNTGVALSDAPGAGGSVRFSYEGASAFFEGRVAAIAVWSNSLPWSADASGDSAIEGAGLHTAYQNWIDESPDAAWRFNQGSTGTSVVDDTGNGADQTSITGTTVINGDDPPGFDFSLDDGTAVEQATETDTAQPITSAKIYTVGQASETDLAQAVTATSTITVQIGQATETDIAQSIAAPGTITVQVGQATETDTALALVSESPVSTPRQRSVFAL